MNDRQQLMRSTAGGLPALEPGPRAPRTRRVRRWTSTALAVCLAGAWAGSATGGAWAANPTLPLDVRTAPNVGGYFSQIQELVNTQAKRLTSTDPQEVSAAREALVAEVQTMQGQSLSAAFLDAYANVVNQRLQAILQTNPDVKLRLNVAIVAAKVAEKAGNIRLVPVVLDLLKDKNEGVVVWGMRAGKGVAFWEITGRVAANQKSVLAPAVVAAAQRFPASGAVAQAAYDALAVAPSGPNGAGVVAAVVPEMQALLQGRVNQYIKGTPPEPLADRVATNYLSSAPVYNAAPPAANLQTAQLLWDLMNVAVARAGFVAAADAHELKILIRDVAKAVWVIGFNAKNQALQTASQRAANIGPQTPVGSLPGEIAPVQPALKAIFPTLKDAPKVEKTQPANETAPPTTTRGTTP